jgi:general stress protein 26
MAKDDANEVKPADSNDKHELWGRLESLRTVMLTTRDAEGRMGARPVTVLKIEDGRMWFFVPITGGIADDVKRDADVLISVMDKDDDLFVSMNGEAEVKRDPAKAKELWSTMAGAWFPGGPDDPNLGVMRIDVHRGDYWDVMASKLVQFYEMAKASLTKKTPENLGDHRRFTN